LFKITAPTQTSQTAASAVDYPPMTFSAMEDALQLVLPFSPVCHPFSRSLINRLLSSSSPLDVDPNPNIGSILSIVRSYIAWFEALSLELRDIEAFNLLGPSVFVKYYMESRKFPLFRVDAIRPATSISVQQSEMMSSVPVRLALLVLLSPYSALLPPDGLTLWNSLTSKLPTLDSVDPLHNALMAQTQVPWEVFRVGININKSEVEQVLQDWKNIMNAKREVNFQDFITFVSKRRELDFFVLVVRERIMFVAPPRNEDLVSALVQWIEENGQNYLYIQQAEPLEDK
jgi:hypothetical protein